MRILLSETPTPHPCMGCEISRFALDQVLMELEVVVNGEILTLNAPETIHRLRARLSTPGYRPVVPSSWPGQRRLGR